MTNSESVVVPDDGVVVAVLVAPSMPDRPVHFASISTQGSIHCMHSDPVIFWTLCRGNRGGGGIVR